MGDDFWNKTGRIVELQRDPATAEARRRIVQPERKPRSRYEPTAIVVLVVIAVITMTLGYLGGRDNPLLSAPPVEPSDVDEVIAASPATTSPATTSPTSIPVSTVPPTTAAAVIEPPSLADDFADDFSGEPDSTVIAATAPTSTTTISPPSSPPSSPPIPTLTAETSGELAAGIAEALQGVDDDQPVLATGLAIEIEDDAPRLTPSPAVAETIQRNTNAEANRAIAGDAVALESSREFIALSTEVFGADGPKVVPLDDEGDAYEINGSVQFEYKSRVIVESYLPFLDRLVDLLEQRPNLTLVVVGHTDTRGDASKNLDLSKARAESVVAYLMFRGIDVERLTALGRGETEPFASNDTEAGRELNRRIQLVLDRVAN